MTSTPADVVGAAEGYPRMRIMGNMCWTLKNRPGTEQVPEFESKVNDALTRARQLAVCVYDTAKISGVKTMDILRSHPLTPIGSGSSFSVFLPLADSRRPETPVKPQPALKITAPIRLERILVVDDNVDAADLTSPLLRTAGHSVQVAFDATNVLEYCLSMYPTVVVLNIGLPVIDGYELAKLIRGLLNYPRPRIAALTGFGQAGDKKRRADSGMDLHMVKPVTAEQLLAAIGAT